MNKYFVNVMIALMAIIIGISLFTYDILKYDFINDIPNHHFDLNEMTITQSFNNKNLIIDNDHARVYVIKDDLIEVGKTQIEVKYYDELITVSFNKIESYNSVILDLKIDYIEKDFHNFKTLYHLAIDNLKNRTIYNYSLLFRPEIYVYVNSVDFLNVKIIND